MSDPLSDLNRTIDWFKETVLPEGSRAAQTPAQRVISLQSEIAGLERDLAEAEAKASRAESSLRRYQEIGGVSFGGIPVAQIWADFILWESLLNEGGFEVIYELGTWEGGFSWWLDAQARARDIGFFTFDSIKPQRLVPRFARMDVFAESEYLIATMRQHEPIILFCDNGNKPRELRTFGTALQHPDSLVVVHDWGTEVQPEDVPAELEMVYEDFCKELGSISRVFKGRAE